MAGKCERCGQTILPDDAVCWQCGARLMPASGAAISPTGKDDADMPAIAWTTLAYLAVSTAVILLLLVWMMIILAQQPLL